MLLAREVDHRARNALAVVQSIVRLTRAQNVDDYVAAVEGRIKALARAHALLSESRWHGADLGVLGGEELAPYRVADADKVEVGGPNVSLLPHMAQGLGSGAARTRHQRGKAWRAVLNGGQGQPHLAAAAGASRAAMAREGRSADCAAGHAQLRPERDPRQRRAAARRQGDVRLGSARAAMHALDPPRRTDQSARTKTGARASRQRLRASQDGSQPPRAAGRR